MPKSMRLDVEVLAPAKLRKLPLVLLPLEDYERMKEDLEMLRSRAFQRRIAKAREAVRKGKTISLEEVKKRLKYNG